MQAVRGTRTEPADSAMPVAGESAHRCSFHPSKRFVMTTRFALTIVLTIVAGLWLDSIGPDWIQVLVSGWTWALLATLCWQVDPARRTLWLICLAWATFGEIVLSLVWGLYDYRLGNLPLFVPPGHVLLFALGMWLTERLPDTLTSVVPALAGGLVLAFALLQSDTLSLPLFAFFLLCVRFGPSPKLYSTMFVLALMMELYGTALGNWTWNILVPGLPLTAANPPLAAGAFYCMLDWLAGSGARRRLAEAESVPAPR
jgi:hypothetical protein